MLAKTFELTEDYLKNVYKNDIPMAVRLGNELPIMFGYLCQVDRRNEMAFDSNFTIGNLIQFDPDDGEVPLGRAYCLTKEDYVVAPNETFLLPAYINWTDVEPEKCWSKKLEFVPDKFVVEAGNHLSMLETLDELEGKGYIFTNMMNRILSIPKHMMLATVLMQEIEETHVVLDPGINLAYMFRDQEKKTSAKEICEMVNL